jgi:signal transduction histidine kinase
MYNAIFPRYPTGCSVCLERGTPQHVRAYGRYFDLLGISARPVTDGLMFPWQSDAGRGTFYILAHERETAFDRGDVRIMEILADFAAIGVRQISQQKQLLRHAGLLAEVAMANTLAHNINNPLQSLINTLYLAAEGHYGESARPVGNQALVDIERLSSLVRELLSLPRRKAATTAP